eukprot:TRINITY_DN1173_c0_g1_i1.p1 TRINITY_DN1173_c0_g1~~TRINITY_DN1173_c0_g1_i1.p1  ORF type:complete len:175 (-),score=33.99 TRINITY_DN1173_c0_g1_i1:935-1459(-)
MDATENDIIAPTLETAFATIMNSLPPTAEKDLQLIHRLFQKKSDVLTKINEFLLHLMRHVKPFLLHPTIASKIVPNGDKTALYTHFSIAMALLFVILRKRRSWMLWSQMLLKSTAQVTRIVATAQQLRFLRRFLFLDHGKHTLDFSCSSLLSLRIWDDFLGYFILHELTDRIIQ